jgi:hypothetical protein
MSHHDVQPPDLLPILSPGKHRNPGTGACFMELASLLAGERFSDHPACTHPLLAAVARHVNDHTSDAGRQRLAELIPSVIGLTGDDLHIDARIALGSATMALPVVRADRQRVMAVSVLTCERVLAELDGRVPGSLEEQSRLALAEVPHAAEWADRFTSGSGPPPRAFAGRPRRPSCRMPWRGSPRPASRTRTGCSVTCWSRRSACARRGSVATGPRWDGRSQLVGERVLAHGDQYR